MFIVRVWKDRFRHKRYCKNWHFAAIGQRKKRYVWLFQPASVGNRAADRSARYSDGPADRQHTDTNDPAGPRTGRQVGSWF